MEDLIVVTFSEEKNARLAMQKLGELDELDDITIYNLVLIQKTTQGKIKQLERIGPDEGDLPMAGASVGMMIGLAAGPVGVLLGGLTGIGFGATRQEDLKEFGEDFIQQVNRAMVGPGYSIIADLEEFDPVIADSYMKDNRGVVLHADLDQAAEKFEQKQWDELNLEIDNKEAELKQAVTAKKAELEVQIDELKKRRQEKIDELKAKIVARKKHLKYKIQILEKKMQATRAKNKNKLKDVQVKLERDLAASEENMEWAFA